MSFLEVLEKIVEQWQATTLVVWYYVGEYVPEHVMLDGEEKPGFYAIADGDGYVFLVHPDHEETFVKVLSEAGYKPQRRCIQVRVFTAIEYLGEVRRWKRLASRAHERFDELAKLTERSHSLADAALSDTEQALEQRDEARAEAANLRQRLTRNYAARRRLIRERNAERRKRRELEAALPIIWRAFDGLYGAKHKNDA